jgi:hypothetical protein
METLRQVLRLHLGSVHVADSHDGLRILIHHVELISGEVVHQRCRWIRLLRLVRLVEQITLLLLQILYSDI